MATEEELGFELFARDRASGEIRRVGLAFDETRQSLDRFNDSGRRSDDTGSRLGQTMGRLGGAVATAGKAIATTTATVAGLASAGITAGVAVAKLVAAAGDLATEVGPAAAALLPLAAGFGLVKATLTAAGPEMVKAIKPITDEWVRQTEAVGKLASVGLEPLAAAFTKANFPSIGGAMQSIARDTNLASREFLLWAGRADGVAAIKEIADGTAGTFHRLAPLVVDVAESLVLLAGRASDKAFDAFGDGAERALGKLREFFDGISKADIAHAFEEIGDAGQRARDGLRAVGDGLAWVRENEETINRVRSALAGLAIVVGIATGGWMLALGGAVTLLTLHWDDLGSILNAAVGWVGDLGKKFPSLNGPVDAARGAVDRIRDSFGDFVDKVAPHVQPFLDRIGDAFIRLQPYITGVISVLGTAISVFVELAGPIVGRVIDALGLLIEGFSRVMEAATQVAAVILGKFADIFEPIAALARKLNLPFADAFSAMVTGARDASDRMTAALQQTKTDLARREIQRLQDSVDALRGKTVQTDADKATIDSSLSRIATLKGRIADLQNKVVYVGTVFYQVGQAPGSYGNGLGVIAAGHASGGPVVGPGTGTSDSILTPLSNGEHVITAAEVRKLGGHAAIERLRKGLAASPTERATTSPALAAQPVAAGVTLTGGTRPAPVVLELRSSGSGLDDVLVEVLRQAIRVRGGGSVQMALGSGTG